MRSPALLAAWALLAAPPAFANPEQPPQPTQLERRAPSEPFQRPRRLGFAAAGPGAQGTKRARGFGQLAADGAQLARRQILDGAQQGLDDLTDALLGNSTLAANATESANSTSTERSSTSSAASRTRSVLQDPTVTALAANGTADEDEASTSRSAAWTTAAPVSDELDEPSARTTRASSTVPSSEATDPAESSSSVRNLRELASSIRAAEAASASSAAAADASDASVTFSIPAASSARSASASASASAAGLVDSLLSDDSSSSTASSASSSSSASDAESSSSSVASSATVTSAPASASSAAASSESASSSGGYGGILSQLGDIFGPKSTANETSSTAASSAESSTSSEPATLTSAPASSSSVNRTPYFQRTSTTPAANLTIPTFGAASSELPATSTAESDLPVSSSVPASSAPASETGVLGNLTAVIPGLGPTSMAAANTTRAPAAFETEPATAANSTVPIRATSTTAPIVGIPTLGLNETSSTVPASSASSVSRGPYFSRTSTGAAAPSGTLSEPAVPGVNATASATQSELEPSSLPIGGDSATLPITRTSASLPLTTSAAASSLPVNGTAAVPGVSRTSAAVLPGAAGNATVSQSADLPGVSANATLSSAPGASVTGGLPSANATSALPSGSEALNATTTERARPSSSVVSSSAVPTSTSVNTEYEWVPTSTLVIAQPKTTTSSSALGSASDSSSGSATTAAPDSSALQQGASTSIVSGKPSVTITSQVSFPTNLPSRIVPADESESEDVSGSSSTAVSQAAADTVPTTTISILLDDSMPWEWVVENSDASGQIFYYVPIVVTAALNVSLDTLETIALQAYQTTNSQGESDILTVFLGALPSSYVDALSAMIQTPSSPIYQQQGLPGQLAQTFVSSFAVTSFASESASSGESASGTSSSDASSATRTSKNGGSSKSKTIIIAVVVTCGVLLIAIAAYFAFRATKSGAVALSASPRLGDRDFRDMAQAPGGGGGALRGFYLNSAPGLPAAAYRQRSGSISTTSTASTGVSSGSEYAPFGSPRAGMGHAASSSVDDRRSSWWRFSDSSGSGHGHGHGQGAIGLAIGGTDTYREGPRRIQIHRGPDGAVAPGMIGRPVVQSNSLML
ncbi:hypothetical protein JCM10450v2_005823 [Rhodotorula kratochvilovae]